ncbi:hypothetical protein [Olleya namhaensis]|uniref:Peptidase S74 domain-containing protein n=1 Tax=Olleya namhaensis TaxID=1144750 RepID=A0A1I3QAK9_9FLAO|nr:hypothetical protein [Olleya namhaensis]SFJ30417.1 hypothetical protein SAMN05443431_10641 [Olleya namhaensis]
MKKILFFVLLLSFIDSNAQVGINNVDPKSLLDVSVTTPAAPNFNDGLLLPRLDVFPAINPNVDQNAMVIYLNNNLAGVNISGTTKDYSSGFYYWDNAVTDWKPFDTVDLDDDWYKAETTIQSTNIADDIFTEGKVGIGHDKPLYGLDLLSNDEERALNIKVQGLNNNSVFAMYNEMSIEGSGIHHGLYNRFSQPITASGEHRGVGTFFISDNNNTHTGIYNEDNTDGTGNHRGVYSQLGGDASGIIEGVRSRVTASGNGSHYGTRSELSGTGTGTHIGSFNLLSGVGTGVQFAMRNTITNSNNNTHYGISNTLSGVGNGSHFGINNVLNNGNGTNIGVNNQISGTGNGTKIGTSNNINNEGSGNHFGTKNELSGIGSGVKYGTQNIIDTDAGGIHYGVYSKVEKVGSWAGYFLGDVRVSQDVTVLGRVTANNFVATNGGFATGYADYVFEKFFTGESGINSEYKFKTIEETEAFAKKYNHLPGVKSYEEIKNNGFRIDLSELTLSSLEKLEEQFLYITQLNKKIKSQDAVIESQDKKIKNLEDRLLKIEALLNQ